jgi:hypothetical protein
MALKIQLRRDIAANWTANNPLLLNGEVGIETDTLKFKVGNGTQRWNSLSSYALKPGEPNGVATLNSEGKIPLSQLPDQISLDSEALLAIQNALGEITTSDIEEGSNLYFTNTRAINAVQGLFDLAGSAADALDDAKADATTKANQAVSTAASDATSKVNAALLTAQANSESFTNTAINSLTTSDIEEGSRLYFTNARVDSIVGPLISETRGYVDQEVSGAISYVDNALAEFDPAAAITSTSNLPEGSNLYFTNARAISATNSARLALLQSALSSVDDLRTEINQSLTGYIPSSDRNIASGVAGLNVNGQIEDSYLSSSIARTSDLVSAIEGVIDSAPTAFDTLKEIADYISTDQTAASSLTTLVGTKLSSELAATTYAPISSPTFTGTVTIPAGAAISGYATSIQLSDAITAAETYTDLAIDGINNSLGDYIPESERNQNNGFAGLDSSGKILSSALPTIVNSMLENNSITINGSSVSLGSSVITGYTNGVSGANVNKITYGTNITPPSSGNSAGDIYIQF